MADRDEWDEMIWWHLTYLRSSWRPSFHDIWLAGSESDSAGPLGTAEIVRINEGGGWKNRDNMAAAMEDATIDKEDDFKKNSRVDK